MYEGSGNIFSPDLSLNEYIKEFNLVLRLFIFVNKKMVNEKRLDLKNEQEDSIRNLLVDKYLNEEKYKRKFNLENLFIMEGGETSEENTYKNLGRIDITILSPDKMKGDRKKAYVFECKRLDGIKTKNDLYIDEGLNRFVIKKYSKEMFLSGMVGFVQGFSKGKDLNDLIMDISNILKKHKKIITIQNLKKTDIDKGFKFSYHSKHKRSSSLNIDIYHLFFDYT